MATYDLRRLDGDPTYAPGLIWDGATPYWRPTRADVKAGYALRSYRLADLSEADRAAKCRELTRELLRWRAGQPKVQPHTWEWIIARYKGDELSPIRDVKENSRRSYIEVLDGWLKSRTFAETLIADTTFETLKMLHRAMENNGRSTAFIHRRFNHLRMVARYGLQIKPDLFRDVVSILSAMRFKSPKPRTIAPSGDQIFAVIAQADKAGASGFALGLSLQWWLTLRAVDVRGQWFGKGATRRWGDGLTWDMVDLDGLTIRKMISKTERHDERPMVWDLSPLEDLVERLRAVPMDQRIGAVVKAKDGKPFEIRHYRELWRRFARAAGIPDEVQLMDTRAGAINDAMRLGADRMALQHAANHKNAATTERYIRAREVGANNVILLRAGK